MNCSRSSGVIMDVAISICFKCSRQNSRDLNSLFPKLVAPWVIFFLNVPVYGNFTFWRGKNVKTPKLKRSVLGENQSDFRR